MCNFTGGYTCPACGLWLEYGTIHYCSRKLPVPLNYNYKCPCGGEFNTPIEKNRNKDGTTISKWVNGKYSIKYMCPFCGREMIGLN